MNVDIARVLTGQGFSLLLLYGMFAASVLVMAASIAARRTGAMPRSLATAGFVLAPLLLAGAAWIPQFLVPLWVLASSVQAIRRAGGGAVPPVSTRRVDRFDASLAVEQCCRFRRP